MSRSVFAGWKFRKIPHWPRSLWDLFLKCCRVAVCVLKQTSYTSEAHLTDALLNLRSVAPPPVTPVVLIPCLTSGSLGHAGHCSTCRVSEEVLRISDLRLSSRGASLLLQAHDCRERESRFRHRECNLTSLFDCLEAVAELAPRLVSARLSEGCGTLPRAKPLEKDELIFVGRLRSF